MSKLDEYSPFRYYLKEAKSTSKKRGVQFNLTLQLLYDQWYNQEGKCVLTGLQMILPPGGSGCTRPICTPTTASLVRIDSSFGYIEDNVQFVCYSANLAKNNFTNDEIVGFINGIRSITD